MSDLRVGDKIRILEDRHHGARVVKGDVLKVEKVHEDFFETEAPRLVHIKDTWQFEYEDEGSGWEKFEGDDE